MNAQTLQYVRKHDNDDVRLLALRGCKDPNVDLTLALQQIQGRQTARQKLPSWAAIDGLLYPPHINMEQCSSEQTAKYKASVAKRLVSSLFTVHSSLEAKQASSSAQLSPHTSHLIDLTGGFGVDFAWMSDCFDTATYVERDAQLFAVSSSNFDILGKKVKKICSDGMDVFHSLDHVTMLFLDPARRDEHGNRTYGIGDCTPDVLSIKDKLLQKADIVMLKLSPMLDWRKAVNDLGAHQVSEVHIVSVDGECKELLIVMQREVNGITIFCVNNNSIFTFHNTSLTPRPLPHTSPLTSFTPHLSPHDPRFLLVPNASVMKAGCFAELSEQFGVEQIAANSHLFISAEPVADFPGRQFRIEDVTTMGKRELKQALLGLKQANIAVRNFPLSVAELRRRLKLDEGGSKYIFATTLANGEKVLIICQR